MIHQLAPILIQNDYAYANWVCTQNNWEPWTHNNGCWEYNGPSYTAATSLPIYLSEEV